MGILRRLLLRDPRGHLQSTSSLASLQPSASPRGLPRHKLRAALFALLLERTSPEQKGTGATTELVDDELSWSALTVSQQISAGGSCSLLLRPTGLQTGKHEDPKSHPKLAWADAWLR